LDSNDIRDEDEREEEETGEGRRPGLFVVRIVSAVLSV
jgi:hypothetical protein